MERPAIEEWKKQSKSFNDNLSPKMVKKLFKYIKFLESEKPKTEKEIIKDIELKPGMKLQSEQFPNVPYEIIVAKENVFCILLKDPDNNNIKTLFHANGDGDSILFLPKGATLAELNKDNVFCILG